MHTVLQRIYEIGIVPVIAIDDAALAVPLGKALAAGGIPAAEVTFRTAAGEEAIRQIAAGCPEVLVGAGTVLNVEQGRRAIAAGARYIVSPGYNEELVAFCQEQGVPVLPGCVNASDMTRAVNAGLEVVKFFPAEQSGGLAFLKALAPVFPKLRFMPTGGVNAQNLLEYLRYERIVACGGTWMVKKDLIQGERWADITRICQEAVQSMLGFSLHHVGMNCADEADAMRTADAISACFGFSQKSGGSSLFVDTCVECMKAPFRGTHGHIAIGVNNVDRAVYHMLQQGVRFDEGTKKTDDTGRTKAIYLADEIGGFAFHLVQK
ncbi:MAG: bifunctional 4-hydroxy-2-oxoglutarate aldolase/2-dehydro-3-deoxy-phosphogluconate aldolase [Clostridia bacterium]|nr:bifunctional 4-hydroxy-2-oxoglutarate aldolase/2-dehydro-3-deoxy-phosphogluconate aldolase [Clostridia bacterium]